MTEPLKALTARLGPLPVWVWGVAGAGAVLIGRNLRGRFGQAASETPASDEQTGTPPAASSPEAGGLPSMTAAAPSMFPASPAPSPYSDGTSTVAASSTPTTNMQWRKAGERWALDNLAWSGIVITSALQRYLDGAALNGSDASIVNSVIRAIGAAPEGAPEIILQPGVSAGNAPVPPNTAPIVTAPPAPKTVTVPTPSIKKGQRGAAVIELQTELAGLGLDPGPIDGNYGNATQAAVLRLQKMLGMTNTTGIEYGPIAAERLRAWKLSH